MPISGNGEKTSPDGFFYFRDQQFPLSFTDGQIWNFAQRQPDSVETFRCMKERRDKVLNLRGQSVSRQTAPGFVKNEGLTKHESPVERSIRRHLLRYLRQKFSSRIKADATRSPDVGDIGTISAAELDRIFQAEANQSFGSDAFLTKAAVASG